MSENLNIGYDFMSIYLKSNRDKDQQATGFVRTQEKDTEILKAPEFLENVKKTLNMKKVDPEEVKDNQLAQDSNLLLNTKTQNTALDRKLANLNSEKINNNSYNVSNISINKDKQIIDELFDKISK